MPPRFDAVAFDLDGTLYPNREFFVRLAPFAARNARLLRAFGRARGIIRGEQELSPDVARHDFYDYQARLVADILGRPADETRARIETLMYRGWEPIFSRVRLFPRARALLDDIRGAGMRLGLLSDFPPVTKLANLGLAGIWDAVLCSEEVGALKPSALPFGALARELGVPAGRVLYVGNSRRYDVEGAARAGMGTALVERGFLPSDGPSADFAFRDYRQLRAFLLE